MRGSPRIAWPLLAVASLLVAQAAWPDGPGPDPSARMLSEDAASEYWDLHVRLDDGWWVMVRVLVTNVGPGDHNAVVSGQVIRPDGSVQPFQNGRRRARWELAADRRHLKIGSSELDLHGPDYSFYYDSNSRGIHVDVKLVAEHPVAVPAEVLPAGYEIGVLALSAAATATLELPGMDAPLTRTGRAALVHSTARVPEAELVTRRIEFFSLQKQAPSFLLALDAPDGVRRTWFYRASQPVTTAAGFEVVTSGVLEENRKGAGDRKRKYAVPRALGVPEGEIKTDLRLDEGILELDPLSPLPAPIRWLVSMTMSPRRVWALTGFEVKLAPVPNQPSPDTGSSPPEHLSPISSEPGSEKGNGLTALTFTNPLPDPLPNPVTRP